MVDNAQLEEIGRFVAKSRDEVIGITDANLDSVRKELADHIADNKEIILETVTKLIAEIETAQSDAEREHCEAHVKQLQEMADQVREYEIFEAQIDKRLADLKDGEPGKDGVDGIDGLDGADRPLVEPVELKADKDYDKNTLGTFRGGLWISTKKAVGDPEDDPLAWTCILDSMTEMSVDLQSDHTYKLTTRLATGKVIENEFHIPYPEHKGIWEEGHYRTGQIVTKGHSMWQAMEDTNGCPPGNGWKQILSAPRGKTGPPGKSITGPQGKPGRNGMDAELPPNFVEEVRGLATKIFEDGRSGAEAITSYRGFYYPNEAYRAGDVVNHDGNLYLCISGGSWNRFSEAVGSFELLVSVPKYSNPGWMIYQGNWTQKEYATGSVVVDNGWTMVALRPTFDKPAPQPIGSIFWVSGEGDTPTWGAPSQSIATKEIAYGQRYTFTRRLYVTGVRIWVDEAAVDKTYRVTVVYNPGTADENTNIILAETAFGATGWVDIPVGRSLVLIGQEFSVVVQKFDRAGGVSDSYNYDYSTPQNTSIPGFGEIIHSRSNTGLIRISKTDNDAVDRSSVIEALQVGDLINGAGVIWTITSVDINIAFVEFGVSPTVNGVEGIGLFEFTTYQKLPIDYVTLTDHYVANDSVIGVYRDGVDSLENEEMYGVDLSVQDVNASEDWGVISAPEGA